LRIAGNDTFDTFGDLNMASSSQTAEAKELSLLSKVEMRIALADTESKLAATLKTYLPPMLLKLASEHISVRNKVRALQFSGPAITG